MGGARQLWCLAHEGGASRHDAPLGGAARRRVKTGRPQPQPLAAAGWGLPWGGQPSLPVIRGAAVGASEQQEGGYVRQADDALHAPALAIHHHQPPHPRH